MIIRGPRSELGFTQLDNDVLRDPRLSFRARGLLASILSRPDNWRTDARTLASEGKEGRDAILTAMNELVAAGYIVREKRQDKETGRWVSIQLVFDRPATSGAVGPGDGFPEAGKPDAGKFDAIETLDTNNPLTPGTGELSCSKHKRRKSYCSDCKTANKPRLVIPDWCGECDPAGEQLPSARWIDQIQNGKSVAMKCPRCFPIQKENR